MALGSHREHGYRGGEMSYTGDFNHSWKVVASFPSSSWYAFQNHRRKADASNCKCCAFLSRSCEGLSPLPLSSVGTRSIWVWWEVIMSLGFGPSA